MTVSKIETNPSNPEGLFELLTASFAYMAGRIDPPSSLTRMTRADVTAKAASDDLFVIRDDTVLVACLFGTPRGAIYYVGKLAVAHSHRGQGLARQVMEAAASHAKTLGHTEMQLESRVELTENHAAFASMGFTQCGASVHACYDQPTSLTFRRPL